VASERKGEGDVSEARAEVLGRVRAAIGPGAGAGAAVVTEEWEALPRGYRRAASMGREEILEMLEDRLRDYDATVVRVGVGEVSAAIGRMLRERGKRRVVVPVGFQETLRAEGNPPFAENAKDGPPDFEFVVDEGLTAAELDGFEGVVTGSTVAIAETGTIVLQNVPGQGRRAATLVPDYHLCVVRAEDVVETVPEAMDRLAGTAELATTFVSGPSATADIEMTRIKGVHGPRFLDVVLVG
jgi:L-lactate dehydrogenase complex protein LldG